MNCKPGDLAVIRNSWGTPCERGLVVSVVRLTLGGEVVRMKNGGESNSRGVIGWLCDANHSGFPCFIADQHLRPIRDNDGEDETLTWAPREVTA